MKLAFKKSKYVGLLSRAIDWLSGNLGYSHVELVFSDGLSFSSTSMDGDNGPRYRKINYSHLDEWTFIEIYLTPYEEFLVREKADQICQAKARYDFAGVFRFILPFIKEHKKDYFCSEVVITVLQSAGMFKNVKPWQTSPNKFYELVTKEQLVCY